MCTSFSPGSPSSSHVMGQLSLAGVTPANFCSLGLGIFYTGLWGFPTAPLTEPVSTRMDHVVLHTTRPSLLSQAEMLLLLFPQLILIT